MHEKGHGEEAWAQSKEEWQKARERASHPVLEDNPKVPYRPRSRCGKALLCCRFTFHRRSIAAEPWGCLTKPVAKIIVRPMLISGILTAEIQIGEEPIHAIGGLAMQLTVGAADPAQPSPGQPSPHPASQP